MLFGAVLCLLGVIETSYKEMGFVVVWCSFMSPRRSRDLI